MVRLLIFGLTQKPEIANDETSVFDGHIRCTQADPADKISSVFVGRGVAQR